MNQLQIINQDGQFLVDSRKVATMIGKRHDNLVRDIDGYVRVLTENTELKIEVSGFFIETSYQDGTGRNVKRYDITRKGCDMVANKMTGTKGVLFTATYVTEFEEMEQKSKQPVVFTERQALAQSLRLTAELVEEVDGIKSASVQQGSKLLELETKLDNQITLDSGQQRRLQQSINKKVCVTEPDKQERGELFRQIHKEIKDRWQVPSYKDVLRQDLQGVLDYISAWVPIRRAG